MGQEAEVEAVLGVEAVALERGGGGRSSGRRGGGGSSSAGSGASIVGARTAAAAGVSLNVNRHRSWRERPWRMGGGIRWHRPHYGSDII